MAGWTGKRVNVSFSKPEEPAFLKRFKERVGYKEDHGLSEKAATPFWEFSFWALYFFHLCFKMVGSYLSKEEKARILTWKQENVDTREISRCTGRSEHDQADASCNTSSVPHLIQEIKTLWTQNMDQEYFRNLANSMQRCLQMYAAMPAATDEDLADQDDELPQVVSLRPGDLTQEEYNTLREEGKVDDLLDDTSEEVQGPREKDEEPPTDGKIMFRKPTKRIGEEKEGKTDPKKLKGDEGAEKSEKKSKREKKKDLLKKKLLSFNEDEEDEEY